MLNGVGADIKISPSVATGGHNLHVDPTDDVVLNCLLDGGTVLIEAHSITVDKTGVNNGSIHTTGVDGMKLYAGLQNNGHDKCVDPSTANALASTIDLKAAVLQDDNGNGKITFTACGDVHVNQGATLTSHAGKVHGECLFPDLASTTPWCTLTVDSTTFFGNVVELFSKGDMTLTNISVTTESPRDQQTFISYFGSVLAGTGCPQPGPPPLECIPIDQACLFCQGCSHNSFSGGIENNFFAYGHQEVDFSGACMRIAENITITAIGRIPTAPYTPTGGGVGPLGAYYINLADAEIRDDFGKTGFISITALPPLSNGGTPFAPGDVPFQPPGAGYGCSPSWFGTGPIWYDQAVLVDEGKNGGADDPQAVSFMNGCRTRVAGDCGPVTLHCDPTPIPHHGIIADPADRVLHFVAGTPRCDS